MKVEWELDFKVTVDGKDYKLSELPPCLLDSLVNEALDGGLRPATGEFEHAWK